MERRSARDARKSLKKVNEALSRGASAAGPSLLSTLESNLLDVCLGYLDMKADGWGPNDARVATKRGEIRGLARAVAKIRLPYENQSDTVRKVEKEFIRKAKDNG